MFFKKENKSIYNQFFSRKKEFFTMEEIVFITKSQPPKEYDWNQKIHSVSTLKKATPTDISFLTNNKYLEQLEETEAGAVFCKEDMLDKVPKNTIPLVSDNPHYAYTQLLDAMFQVPIFEISGGLARKSNIAWSAKIGKGCQIQAGAFIGKNVVIGNNCKICANAVIHDNCIIGNDTYIGSNATIQYTNIGKECVIHNGACIGQCGFGFAHDKAFNYKIPQIGKVVIGDYVEIGANTCIDRGALDDTTIGNNTKIDNLLQIAHGVKIGAGCFFAACTGIAGSAEIGNYVQIGGHSAIAGHIRIADGVIIAAHSGVIDSIDEPASIWGGAPALPHIQWKREQIMIRKLGRKK
ncbi:MAG: UDP-3-O-(3-hydroxymyristoyl)glucosamine N-acyltransferase [Rickettsiales bacterium]|nr:MAG: UDP-3-O-(3-hydroxymyristoyl)glucosamine N-acyltransferase [Rickettsiales bacterium]